MHLRQEHQNKPVRSVQTAFTKTQGEEKNAFSLQIRSLENHANDKSEGA